MQNKSVYPPQRLGALIEAVRHLRLTWRLFRDGRVPIWLKTIPFLALAYVLFPLDFLPDAVLGLGQLDDLALLLLGIELFVNLCPTELVRQHKERLSQAGAAAESSPESVVDSTYRVQDRDEHP